MSLMASLVTTSRMQQCFNVLIDIYYEFQLLLIYVGNKSYYYYYNIYVERIYIEKQHGCVSETKIVNYIVINMLWSETTVVHGYGKDSYLLIKG